MWGNQEVSGPRNRKQAVHPNDWLTRQYAESALKEKQRREANRRVSDEAQYEVGEADTQRVAIQRPEMPPAAPPSRSLFSLFRPTGIAEVRLQKTRICEWKLIELAEAMFQPTFLERFEDKRFSETQGRVVTVKKHRGIWELYIRPSVQCEKAITSPSDICWLCGDPTAIILGDRNNQESCDHVLPIAQAVMFLGLFKTPDAMERVIKECLRERNDERITPAIDAFKSQYASISAEQLDLEYAWSHLGCNIAKRDAVFIKLNEAAASEGKVIWEVDIANIQDTLDRIRRSSLTSTYSRNWFTDTWLRSRTNKIATSSKISTIVATLNARKDELTIHQLYRQAMTRCTTSAMPRAVDFLNAQVNLTAAEIFGHYIPTWVSKAFSIPAIMISFIKGVLYGPPKYKGEGRSKKPRNKKRNKKTRRVKKH